MDKYLHFIVSAAITIASMAAICIFNSDLVALGLIPPIAAGAGKELYDYYHPEKHTASFMDLVWDFLGIVVGSLLFVFFAGMFFYGQ